MDLYEILEEVKDKESFLKFVDALIEDRKQASYSEKLRASDYQLSSDDWQSVTIESYLESASSWLRDYQWKDRNPDEMSWKRIAVFLYCGKIYE